MKVLEVNDNDIYGKIFNGYSIMEELNKTEKFDVNQLVINKVSNNVNCRRLFPNEEMIDKDFYLHKLEHDLMSTHSLLSTSTLYLKNNKYYKESDLVHFHQVHNSRFCLPTFFKMALTKPTIISFHDPWFMTGRCVHPFECNKWEKGCNKCSNLNSIFDLVYDNCSELWKIKSLIANTDIDIIVHSKWMYNMVKKNPYTKNLRVHEVPLGIDMSKYNFDLTKEEAKRKLSIPSSSVVLFFREQKELKGTNYIVDALKKIEDKSNITLLTCSQKGLLKEIENDYNIIELGILTEEEILLCYNASDIFLMPSLGESFGMMAVEAMAAGLPTIVFDNSALPDTTCAPEIGILVKTCDSDDLFEKIDFYIKNPAEREKRGVLSKKFVSEKYDYNIFFTNIKKIYMDAFEKQKYKLSKVCKSDININYNDENVKKVLCKLNKIYENIFPNKNKPHFLKKEYVESDKIIFSNNSVICLIEKFNNYMYHNLKKKRRNLIFMSKKKFLKNNQTLKSVDNSLPKVSIIIPVYNGEKYVSLAIDSALRQTYANIEIIVVNDGSKDNTEKICKSYGEKIKYIKKENGGVSTALNVGIENMTGDYFSWLSHDDLYYPEKVAVEVEYLKKNNLLGTNTILYSNFSIMDGFGNLVNDIIFDDNILNSDSAFSLLKGAINGLTLLIPRKAFMDVGLFDEKLRCVQDYKLWFDMYKFGYKFVHITNVLAVTRVHSESVTNTSPKVVTEGNAFWLDVINYFSDKEKNKLYGSIYNYYYNLYNFFNYGPYNEAIDFCKTKYEEIENKNKEKINSLKVSIIIPFFNDIKYVINCINSTLNQTHKNIEIILINNGSTDNTKKIEDIIKKNDDRITYITYKTRKKRSNILNDCIKKTSGDYIVFLNQYCILDNKRLEIQLLKMLCSGDIISHTSYYKNLNNSSNYVDSGFFNGFVISSIINDCVINFSTVMLYKPYIIDNRILFEECDEPAEDVCLYLRILKNNRILGISEPLITDYLKENITDNKLKINSIIRYIFNDKDFMEKNNEIVKLLYTYIGIIDNNKEEGLIKQCHFQELERFKYMQSNEYRRISKIRNMYKKVLFKKTIPSYLLDNYSLVNSRLNKLYRKICDIKYKIKNK